MGRCVDEFSQAELKQIAQHKRTLWALSKLPKDQVAGVELSMLVLLRAVAGPSAHDAPRPAEKLFMVPLALFNPTKQVYWQCRMVGEHFVDVPLDLNTLSTDAELATWMLREGPELEICRLSYRVESLTRFVVTATQTVNAEVDAISKGTGLEDELAFLKAQQQAFSSRQRQQRAGARQRASQSSRPSRPDDADDSSDNDDDIDDENAQEFWQAREEWRDAAADADIDEDLPRMVQVSADLIHYMDPKIEGRKLARQTVIRRGQKNESNSVYCYLHGCSRCRRPATFPLTQDVQRWVKAAADLPSGQAGKMQHLRLWDAMASRD